MTRVPRLVAAVVLAALASSGAARQEATTPGGYIIEHDADVAREEAGPHDGGGRTVGYSFFRNVPRLQLVFRKRALTPGSGIGHHVQTEDEIYYVLSGRGVMTLDGQAYDLTPGTAVLTRTGSSHSLKQVGAEDLVVLINYQPQSGRTPEAGGRSDQTRRLRQGD